MSTISEVVGRSLRVWEMYVEQRPSSYHRMEVQVPSSILRDAFRISFHIIGLHSIVI